MKQFIVKIHGPICSGKTTLAKTLHQKFPRTYLISSDRLKWLLSDYNPKKDRDVIAMMVYDVINRALLAGYNVIQDSSMLWVNDEVNKNFDSILENYEAQVFHYNLEAPLPVLLERLNNRVQKDKEANVHPGITSKDSYLRSYERYNVIKKNYETFDTTILSINDIAKKIIKDINNAQ